MLGENEGQFLKHSRIPNEVMRPELDFCFRLTDLRFWSETHIYLKIARLSCLKRNKKSGYIQGRRLRGGGKGGQLHTPRCPRLSNCPPLPLGFLMHKIVENQPGWAVGNNVGGFAHPSFKLKRRYWVHNFVENASRIPKLSLGFSIP